MGRTDSILWFKGNGVKPKEVLHISPSSRKWFRDRSGGSSTADKEKWKLVLDFMKVVLVVVFVALPPVSIGRRGVGLEMVGVFDGPGDRVGGSRYHTESPNVKSYKLRVSKTCLLTILDGRKRKRKRIMLSGNEPHYFLGN